MFYKKKETKVEQLKQLYPNENVQVILKKQKRKTKRKIGFLIGFFLVFLISYQMIYKNGNECITEIKRGDKQETSDEIKLIVEADGIKPYEMKLKLENMKYTPTEIEELYFEFSRVLEKNMLGKNEALNFVTSDLNLMEKIEGYPFQIKWQSSNYELVTHTGEILVENILKNMENQVTITANIQYLTFEREVHFILTLYKKETKEEMIKNAIQMGLLEIEKNTRESEYMQLPEEIEGISIKWKKKEKNYILDMAIFVSVFILAWIVGEREKEKREQKKRNQEMNFRYPEVVTKLTLLLCAGYTLRKAWEQVAVNYEKRKEKIYVYEQMLYTVRKMEKSVSEGIAYEEFGKRCQLESYRKLGVLLSQNLKRGNKNVVERMKEEVRNAYKIRREKAKEMGEKAQTKMLLPMMLLFIIVLFVIVMPIFISM